MDTLRGLTVWNSACRLAVDTYKVIANCEDPTFREQLALSSIAIPSSIADGYERKSRPQFARFLHDAQGSCARMRTQLYIAAELELLDSSASHRLIAESIHLSKMLDTLINRCDRLRT